MNIKNKQWDKRYKSIFMSNILNENAWLENAKDLIDAASSFEPEVYRVWDDLRLVQPGGEVTTKRTGYFGTYYLWFISQLVGKSLDNFQ